MLFFLCLFGGIYQFISQSLGIFPLPCTIRNWEDGQLQILWFPIKISQFLIYFFHLLLDVLPSTSSGWDLGFPCQIAVTGGKRPIFSPLHISLPLPQYTHHSKAFADVATCPHEYTSFVHWKAQILCKELLLYHLAICEFFSSLDVCEKAGTQRPESKPFTSNSLEKR